MYMRYYGFRERPFSLTPDPRFLFLSDDHFDALEHLIYGITGGEGFLLLSGEVGTGKTTLTRGVLIGLGHRGAARSPTYTLLEPYELALGYLYHLDLYRLGDPEELEYLGLRDLLADDAVWMVEWPERGLGMLPPPDLRITIAYASNGRRLDLSATTPAGRAVLDALHAAWVPDAPGA